MNGLVVGGTAAATVLGVGGLALTMFMTSDLKFLPTGSPEQLAEVRLENIKTAALFVAIIGAGAFIAYKTPYTSAGTGIMVGGGGLGAFVAYNAVFPEKRT
jgi:hypothetical protein